MKKKRGFSLIEALVVLFLTVCIMWGTLPQFLRHQKERELKLACLTVKQTFNSARFQAIKDRKNFEVIINHKGNILRIGNVETGEVVGREEKLPDGISIVSFSNNFFPIIFRPDGGLSGISGSMVVRDERTGRGYKMILYNLTGKVKIESL
ncbi:MAG: prepilin-type N-terminal cleavage/methylation domain-containing protein [Candidatus Ratteibacteria bacterium]|jgi:Tfp pilus assembly protein FimT